MELVQLLLPALSIVALAGGALLFLWKVQDGRNRITLKEIEIRELEARAKLADAQARALPEYVDSSDPSAVDAYRRARQEVNARTKEL